MHRVLLVGGWCVLLPTALTGCRPVEDPGSAHLDVDAGDDLPIEEGEWVTLSASVGGRTKGFGFCWEYQAGPAPMDADEEDLNSPELELGPFVVLGNYKFRVVASTADGRFGQDFIVVIVEPAGGDNDNATGDENDNADDNANDNTTYEN